VKLYLADQKTLAEDAADSDLWSEFASGYGDRVESSHLTNTPFTDAERERIETSLGQFMTQVLELGVLTHDQLALLNGKVDQLIQNAKSPWMGRREWLGTFAGSLVGFIVQEALGSGPARRLLQLAGEAIGWVSQHPIFLPPPAF
jgi:hypothetical protein